MVNSLKSVAYNTLLQEWGERIKECRASELTVKAWCLEHGIKLSTYYTCQKRVFNAVSFHPNHTFIACGYTDIRRGIDGLATIVQEQFKLDPFTTIAKT